MTFIALIGEQRVLGVTIFLSFAVIGYFFADEIVKYTDIRKAYERSKQRVKRAHEEVSNG